MLTCSEYDYIQFKSEQGISQIVDLMDRTKNQIEAGYSQQRPLRADDSLWSVYNKANEVRLQLGNLRELILNDKLLSPQSASSNINLRIQQLVYINQRYEVIKRQA